MSGAVMEIPSGKWEIQRKLDLAPGLRDAVRDLLRRQWPQHTAKNAARAYGLTLDRAREAANGRASLTTLEAMIQKGRLAVALPIVEAVSGQSIAHFFRELREEHEEHGRRLATLFDDPAGPRGADRSRSYSRDRVATRESEPAANGMGRENRLGARQ